MRHGFILLIASCCLTPASLGAPASATYTYDAAGRLGTTTWSNAAKVTYTLDAAGNRTSVVTNGPDATAPSVPAALSATRASATQVNLSWNAATDSGGSGLAGYIVYRGGTQIATTAGTSYSDTNITSNQPYTVAAYDNAGNTSAQSSSATPLDNIAPSVPAGLTATRASAAQVNLAWSAATDTGGSGLAGYVVYRSGTQIATTGSTSYSDTNATSNLPYTVAAYDNAGNTSAQSGSATPVDNIAPSTPSLTSAVVNANASVTLNWSAATDTGGSGLAGYQITRTCPGATTFRTAATGYTDTTAPLGATCSYTVAAYDGAGNFSGASNAATVTIIATDTATLTQGIGYVPGHYYLGFNTVTAVGAGTFGSLSPSVLTGGKTVVQFLDTSQSVFNYVIRGGAVSVSGFSADPGQSWLISATALGVTFNGSSAVYTYSGGSASWSWGPFGFTGKGTGSVTIVHH
jgi:YD repeat-containing protein